MPPGDSTHNDGVFSAGAQMCGTEPGCPWFRLPKFGPIEIMSRIKGLLHSTGSQQCDSLPRALGKQLPPIWLCLIKPEKKKKVRYSGTCLLSQHWELRQEGGSSRLAQAAQQNPQLGNLCGPCPALAESGCCHLVAKNSCFPKLYSHSLIPQTFTVCHCGGLSII